MTLRAPRPSDKADHLALGRDPEIVRMFGGSPSDLAPLTQGEVDTWYAETEAEPHAWMIEHAGRCIGMARLHSLDASTQSARYAIGILDPVLLDKGLGRVVTSLVLTHAFETLDPRRVDLRVLAFNTRAIRSYEASGFRREGIERAAAEIDGEFYDDIVMSITRTGRP